MSEITTSFLMPKPECRDATAGSSIDTDDSSTEVASIPYKLRNQAPTDISRKRGISSNPPKGQRKEYPVSPQMFSYQTESENF